MKEEYIKKADVLEMIEEYSRTVEISFVKKKIIHEEFIRNGLEDLHVIEIDKEKAEQLGDCQYCKEKLAFILESPVDDEYLKIYHQALDALKDAIIDSTKNQSLKFVIPIDGVDTPIDPARYLEDTIKEVRYKVSR